MGLGGSSHDIVLWLIEFLEGFPRIGHSRIVLRQHFGFDLCPSQDLLFCSGLPLIEGSRDVFIFVHDIEGEPLSQSISKFFHYSFIACGPTCMCY